MECTTCQWRRLATAVHDIGWKHLTIRLLRKSTTLVAASTVDAKGSNRSEI
jgi:hypothetical protein